jgi:hypothetical protein
MRLQIFANYEIACADPIPRGIHFLSRQPRAVAMDPLCGGMFASADGLAGCGHL